MEEWKLSVGTNLEQSFVSKTDGGKGTLCGNFVRIKITLSLSVLVSKTDGGKGTLCGNRVRI